MCHCDLPCVSLFLFLIVWYAKYVLIVQIIFLVTLGLLSLFWCLWKQSSAYIYTRGRKQCCELHNCLWRISIKPTFIFSICNVFFVSKTSLETFTKPVYSKYGLIRTLQTVPRRFLLQFFFICASVVSYKAFVLSSLVPPLSFFGSASWWWQFRGYCFNPFSPTDQNEQWKSR